MIAAIKYFKACHLEEGLNLRWRDQTVCEWCSAIGFGIALHGPEAFMGSGRRGTLQFLFVRV